MILGINNFINSEALCPFSISFNQQNGIPIGSGDTVHDSKRMTLEIVDGLTACVEDGRVIKYRH
jgi:hypothetical protein